jgi:hypothetical protein
MGSLFFFEVVDTTPRELDAACFAGYLAGLQEVGWDGDARLVRLGYTAALALRHTVAVLQLLVPSLTDPDLRPDMEDLFGGYPLEELMEHWAALWPFQFQTSPSHPSSWWGRSLADRPPGPVVPGAVRRRRPLRDNDACAYADGVAAADGGRTPSCTRNP